MRDLCASRSELTAPVLLLLKCRGEGIVSVAESFPFGSDNNRFRAIDYTIRVLGENNRKSGLEMPLPSERVNEGSRAVVDGDFGWEERTRYLRRCGSGGTKGLGCQP